MTEPGPGEAVFQFVRHWARRTNAPADVLVVEAVHALSARDEVTVNDVATELGVDQSGASRMVTRAVDQGYLATHPSPADARRRTVTVTGAGSDLLAAAHRWQEEVFATMTDSWTAAERAAFHRATLHLLTRSRSLG
ncbi:MarR family winged helix-turn-helix transcriptional regulator [Paractinoplanes rishiriensis]|uniref:MarR family transcriptional regulator n=1 Tax=Paractinoplanes rishiriensis TaxID=1050105 RepID=A0A919JTH1_9ACTN|nr:MarR family winged helix-turn-helix transcriptional regulator [Actinoplanes rishiriensis]GIE94515.1 MarR family transcriptional regulator [Actinoplanes rishiriensis]